MTATATPTPQMCSHVRSTQRQGQRGAPPTAKARAPSRDRRHAAGPPTPLARREWQVPAAGAVAAAGMALEPVGGVAGSAGPQEGHDAAEAQLAEGVTWIDQRGRRWQP